MVDNSKGWLLRAGQEATASRHPTSRTEQFSTGASEQDDYDKELPFDRNMDTEDHDSWVEQQAQAQANGAQAAQRAGQMKREYHRTGGTPKEPKVVDPTVQALRQMRKMKSLSNRARGRRR